MFLETHDLSDFSQPMILYIALAVFLVLKFWNIVETEDVWWHLATGRWIVEHLQVPVYDPFSFAGERIPWVWHEWLGSTWLYLVHKAGGLLGLKLFRDLFFAGSLLIFFLYGKKRLPLPFLAALTIMMAFGIGIRPWLRPDMANLLFVQIFLILLFIYKDTGDRRKLYALPILGMIWFNIHLGAVIYGMFLIGVFWLSEVIQYFNHARNAGLQASAQKRIAELSFVFVVCFAGFLINPYGLDGFLYPFRLFLVPGFADFYKISGTVLETQPPGFIFQSLKYSYLFILMGLGLWAGLRRSPHRITLLILFSVALFSFFLMRRNSTFFIVITGFVVLHGLQGVGFFTKQSAQLAGRVLTILIVIFTGIFSYSRFSEAFYHNGRVSPLYKLESDPFSFNVVRSLKEQNISGKVFNTELIGGMLLFLGYPELKPFVDGRFHNKEHFNNYMAVNQDPERVWPQAQRDYDFSVFILSAVTDADSRMLKYLHNRPDWQLIAVEGHWVVFVRRGVFNLSPQSENFEKILSAIAVSENAVRLREILDRKVMQGSGVFLKPSVFIDEALARQRALFVMGYQGAAIKENLMVLESMNDQKALFLAMLMLEFLRKEGVPSNH